MGGLRTGASGTTTTGNAQGDTAILGNVEKVLSIFSANLQSILNDFKVGNFEDISTQASVSAMDKGTLLIAKNIRNRSTAFNRARELGRIFTEIVSGWKQSVELNDKLANALINLGILEDKVENIEEILNDRDLLLDYLHQKNKQYSILPQLQVSSITAALRAEYTIYIRIWGYPPNGIWDVEKLSNIILDLQMGIIDENGDRTSGYTKPVKE